MWHVPRSLRPRLPTAGPRAPSGPTPLLVLDHPRWLPSAALPAVAASGSPRSTPHPSRLDWCSSRFRLRCSRRGWSAPGPSWATRGGRT
ncbi:MAG: hypothetical protein ACK55Z_25055, partial [bacterium]